MRYIFLISGWCGSGKSLFADYLTYSRNFKQYAIARELKLLVSKKYNIDIGLTLTQKGKSTIINTDGLTLRELLIKEAKSLRKVNDDVFITSLTNTIMLADCVSELHLKKLNHIAIPDFRYLNEYHYINQSLCVANKSKIISIRINRFSEMPFRCNSESQLDNFKFTHYIDNLDSIEEFRKRIELILNQYSL